MVLTQLRWTRACYFERSSEKNFEISEQIQQTKQERDQIAAQTANAQNAAALAGALKDTAAAQAQGLGQI